MSEHRCLRCGSRSHQSYDCSVKGTYVPTKADIEFDRMAAAVDPEVVPAVHKPVKPQIKLLPARWGNGPLICPIVNLPAFETKAKMDKFHADNGPRCFILKVWEPGAIGGCACGQWHYWSRAPSPSGESSGTVRESVLPPGFVPFMRKRQQPKEQPKAGSVLI